MPLNVPQQSWLPRRPSVSSSSHVTTPTSHINLITPNPKPKDKDRSLDGVDPRPLDFGSRHGHSEHLLFVSPKWVCGICAEAIATERVARLTRSSTHPRDGKQKCRVAHSVLSFPPYADADNIGSKSSESSTSPTVHDSSAHSVPLQSHFQQYSLSLPSRNRTSILSVASDALSFRKKIGSVSRKKPNFYSASNVVPEVIEISAYNNTTVTSTVGGTTAHRDYEHEERERLRDVAAQSIGLDPELLHDFCKSESRSSLDSPQNPSQPPLIPPFPATLAALRPFTKLTSTLPKFTPPSSLLVYALAKQWKSRVLVLTSHSPSQKTHAHLFKGSSKDEREIERLEVTESSVIFVAEEEVGGRRHVVKFAGTDVSAKRSEPSGEENLHTMWFLHIPDPTESQRWIAAIKNAVLTQRAARAGLEITAHTDGRNEPKGDIDVMLSMHIQGLISPHPNRPSTATSFPSPPVPASPSPPPSLRSLKINIPASPSPTPAVKGIFSGTRPRSPSVEGTPISAYPPGHAEDSFGAAGSSLLTLLRTKSSADSSSSPSHSLPLPLPHVSRKGSPTPSLRSANAPVIITASDLKISKERDALELSTTVSEASSSTPPNSNTPPTPSFSPHGAVTLSLQPPPRKCKHISATTPTTLLPEQQGMYKQAGGNRSVAGNFGVSSGGSGDVTPRETSPVSPGSSSFSGGRPGSFSSKLDLEIQPPCVGEAHDGEQSNSLSTPRGRFVPSDKLLQSAPITKRWSRQGGPLPKQLTPPSGPPPSIPPSSENDRRTSMESSVSMPVTCATDRSPGSSSSNSHFQARLCSRSRTSLSPTFWKRASGSSTYSASSSSTSDSRGRSQIAVSFGRESFPSSLGLIGKGASSRPMSLLVPVSSHVGHIGTVKRRSMPPPRPAPNFAPPPAPRIQESMSGTTHLMSIATQRKSLRSSVVQRVPRLSLTSPKPPPSSALPLRPDEVVFALGHRRSSSAGTPDLHPVSAPSSRPTSALSAKSNSTESVSPPPRTLSIRQRLRILSTPPTSTSPVPSRSFLTPSVQVSTLDLSDDNDEDDLPTPCVQSSQPFGLGEHIMMMQNEPSFLQLSTPVTPTAPKPPLRQPTSLSSTMSGSPPPGSDRDFIALSPPPPRRGSRPHIITIKRPETLEVERSGIAQREENMLVKYSRRGSVVSLDFVTS